MRMLLYLPNNIKILNHGQLAQHMVARNMAAVNSKPIRIQNVF